jgi:hypothetical protein
MKKNPPDQGGNVCVLPSESRFARVVSADQIGQPSNAVAADQIGTMNAFNEGAAPFPTANDSQFKRSAGLAAAALVFVNAVHGYSATIETMALAKNLSARTTSCGDRSRFRGRFRSSLLPAEVPEEARAESDHCACTSQGRNQRHCPVWWG